MLTMRSRRKLWRSTDLEEIKVVLVRQVEEGSDSALSRENAKLRAQLNELEKKTAEPMFNMVLDAKGRPITWPEIAAHVHRTAKAAGIDSVGFRAAIFNSNQGEDAHGEEYIKLVRWYQAQTRKHQDVIVEARSD